jgi:hypothetical protein
LQAVIDERLDRGMMERKTGAVDKRNRRIVVSVL